MAQTALGDELLDDQAAQLTRSRRIPDHSQVQGLVYSALGSLEHASFDLLHITDPAVCRAWLARLAPRIVTAEQAIDGSKGGTPDKADRGLYVAFTATGLRALGLAEEVIATFADPFIEGIVTPHRSRVLGDHHANDPAAWDWGSKQDTSDHAVDVLVMTVWGSSEAGSELADLVGAGPVGSTNVGNGFRVVHTRRTRHLGPPDDNKEHFGFTDGISNLRFRGELESTSRDDERYASISAGEVVLGCRDESGFQSPSPGLRATDRPVPGDAAHARDLGLDGTYLVLRDLRQDVAAFRRWLVEEAGEDPSAQDELAAKVVGRSYDGTPIVPLDPERSGSNSFGFFHHDHTEQPCPVGAHIRRANPRDGRRDPDDDGSSGRGTGPTKDQDGTLTKTKRHRILRRGRSYGEELAAGALTDDDVDRGLMFVALNADIERQFEFVQGHWLGSETFARPGEVDPLVGVEDDRPRTFTVEARADEALRTRYHGIPQFVTVRGGAYFFLPRRAVVEYLAALA
jgi:Dyp-type peroxidase family